MSIVKAIEVIARHRAGACLLGLLCLSGALRAQFFRPALWGGYTQLQMGQVNSVLDGVKQDVEAVGASVRSQSKLGPGWMLGLDLEFQILPWLSAGPRVEWIEGMNAVLEAETATTTMKATYGGRMLPLALSLKSAFDWGRHASVVAGGSLGWGFGSVFNRAEMKGGVVRDVQASYSGAAPFGELEAALRWQLGGLLSAQASAGWRWAFVPEMKADADESVVFNLKKGDVAKDRAGNPLPMDFSGLTLGLGLGLEF